MVIGGALLEMNWEDVGVDNMVEVGADFQALVMPLDGTGPADLGGPKTWPV